MLMTQEKNSNKCNCCRQEPFADRDRSSNVPAIQPIFNMHRVSDKDIPERDSDVIHPGLNYSIENPTSLQPRFCIERRCCQLPAQDRLLQ